MIQQSPRVDSEPNQLIPRSNTNFLYPSTSKIVCANAALFIELFNNKRVPIRSDIPLSEFPLCVEVIQSNQVSLTCMISTRDLSKASEIDPKKIAILYKRGHLNLYLECLKENRNAAEVHIEESMLTKLANDVSNQTKIISSDDFGYLQNECMRAENQKKWMALLSDSKTINPKANYLLVKLVAPSGKLFKIEFRNNYNMHLRLRKNIKNEGSANTISLHVDLISCVLIAKNKIGIGYTGALDKKRKYTKSAFNDMMTTANRLNHIKGVIPYLKKPEISPDEKKGYFFTEYCPEGDFFDAIINKILTRQEIFRLLGELCATVERIHQQGFIHRDIKLENLLLKKINGAFKLYVGDLEFAEEFKGNNSYKKGTINYGAPETFMKILDPNADVAIGPAIDIYAIGVVAYAALFNHLPLWVAHIKDKHYQSVLEDMKSINNFVSVQLLDERTRRVLQGLMAYELKQRLSLEKAAELFDDLYRNPP